MDVSQTHAESHYKASEAFFSLKHPEFLSGGCANLAIIPMRHKAVRFDLGAALRARLRSVNWKSDSDGRAGGDADSGEATI